MEVILRLLSELRLVLVAIAGICCAAFLFTGLSSLRELRRAVFHLERSAIVSRSISAWLKAGLCAVIGTVIWAATGSVPTAPSNLSSNPLSATPTTAVISVAPTSIPTADLSNASMQMTAVPTSEVAAAPVAAVDPGLALTTEAEAKAQTITPPLASAAAPITVGAPTLAPTQTPHEVSTASAASGALSASNANLPTLPPPTPTPETTVTAEAPPAEQVPTTETFASDCANPSARIVSPGVGETVTGNYVVRGTADFPGGAGRYKIEILRPNVQGWAFLWENFNVVKDGVLMAKFNSGLFPPGMYTLRLSLVDGAGQQTGIYCSVQIKIA